MNSHDWVITVFGSQIKCQSSFNTGVTTKTLNDHYKNNNISVINIRSLETPALSPEKRSKSQEKLANWIPRYKIGALGMRKPRLSSLTRLSWAELGVVKTNSRQMSQFHSFNVSAQDILSPVTPCWYKMFLNKLKQADYFLLFCVLKTSAADLLFNDVLALL